MGFLAIYKDSHAIFSYWAACFSLGVVYLLGLWDGVSSPAFIVGQIFMGVIGMLREYHLYRNKEK